MAASVRELVPGVFLSIVWGWDMKARGQLFLRNNTTQKRFYSKGWHWRFALEWIKSRLNVRFHFILATVDIPCFLLPWEA